jgi:hypothetical protein
MVVVAVVALMNFSGSLLLYPSHLRQVLVHLKQLGFVSSHLTHRILRILSDC